MSHRLFSCHIFESAHLFCHETIESIYLPGKEGDCEIFPHHMPVIQTLRPGMVKLTKSKHSILYVFVSGGIFYMDGEAGSLFTLRAVFFPDEKEETLAQALQHFSYHTLGEIKPSEII